MSARRTDMHQLQEVVRLHRLRCSGRRIARQLHMGRETVRVYLEVIGAAGLLEGSSDELPDLAALRQVTEGIASVVPAQQRSSLAMWEPRITALRSRGVGPKAIHDSLRLNDPDYRGSLSAVKRMCARLDRSRPVSPTDVVIRVESGPGEIAQVDFGSAGKLHDPDRNVMRQAWFFVMTLGFSRHTFAHVVFDQKARTWAQVHRLAFEYFGGVPRVVVPDNLKAAVIRAAFGADDEPVLHRTYREIARHYGFQVDPTPPRSPSDKGKVESAVSYIKHNFFATCEAVDLPSVQRSLRHWLDQIASERLHGTTGRRPRELYESMERGVMLALPRAPWEPVEWKHVRVHRDCHVQVDGAFYSAPWALMHERVWARCTSDSVALYHDDEVFWTHPRVARGVKSTLAEHLPDYRSAYAERSRQGWLDRAQAIGPDTRRLAQQLFETDDVLLMLRRVQAIVTHLEQFPTLRAEAAARRALHFGSTTFQSVQSILRKGLDMEPLPTSAPTRQWASGSTFARPPEVVGVISRHQEIAS